jgi:hypothetical protein
MIDSHPQTASQSPRFRIADIDRAGDAIEKSSGRLLLAPLPPREGARINPNLAGEFLLRHAEGFAMIDQMMRQRVSILKRIEVIRKH